MANKKISDFTATATPQSGDLHLVQRSGAYLKVDNDNLLAGHTTDNLQEGVSNQYFTNERARDAVGAMATSSDGVTLTYNDGADTLTVGLDASNELVKTFTKSISQSEIVALFSTPIDFGLSLAADKCIIPISAFAYYVNAAGAPFSNGDFKICDRTTGEEIFGATSAFLNTSSSVYSWLAPSSTEAKLTPNTDIRIAAKTANPTGGGSGNRLVIILKYIVSEDLTTV